jgi:plastocyanin
MGSRGKAVYRGTVIAILLLTAAPAWAARVSAVVTGAGGALLEDAVVTLVPEGAAPPVKPADGVVDQVKLEFVPYVTVIPAGSKVTFPNSDKVRHHVYSFSPAKTFELPLYAGAAAPAVLFEKPGVVPLGCNIHDWMIGYIYVAATPWAARTGKDGKAMLDGVPPGAYVARAWHPQQAGNEDATQRRVQVPEAGQSVSWSLELKPAFRIPRRSGGKGFGY